MKLVCLGIDHHATPLDLRETLSIPSYEQGLAARTLLDKGIACEAVVLSTCNRTEVYALLSNALAIQSLLDAFFTQKSPLITPHIYLKEDKEVHQHLFGLVGGLQSMVLGETEIFGQVKTAYNHALKAGSTASVLNQLFQKSFSVGKKLRTQTSIQEGPTSIGSVAVELAQKVFGSLHHCHMALIGAGDMGTTIAKRMAQRGVAHKYIVNRNLQRAHQLAEEVEGSAHSLNDLLPVLGKSNVAVFSTASQEPLLTKKNLLTLRSKRRYAPLFLIDVALPRNIDPSVGDIEEVYCYDLDTIELLASQGREKRESQIALCHSMIHREVFG